MVNKIKIRLSILILSLISIISIMTISISDASGIRHAKFLEQGKATFEEAKFMLVACSAFVNYIIGICAD